MTGDKMRQRSKEMLGQISAKRMTAILMSVILMLSALPMSVYADAPETQLPPTIIERGTYVKVNNEYVVNHGTIGTNKARVHTNVGPGVNEGVPGKIEINEGNVATNDGEIGGKGTDGTVLTDKGNLSGGTVETNNGTVFYNLGSIETNSETGTVEKNGKVS